MRKKNKLPVKRLFLVVAIFATLVLSPFDAASSGGPRLRLKGSPRPPGTVALLELRSHVPPDKMDWSGLGQKAGFYEAPSRDGHLYIALIAVPLETKAGEHFIEIRAAYGQAEFVHELPIQVQKDPYPSSRQPLKVKGFKKKTGKALRQEKPRLQKAWASSGGRPRWRGSFHFPVKKYRVSSVFGKRRVYDNGNTGWRHKGVDLAAPEGTPVLAPNHGKVVMAARGLTAYGGVVVLSHGYELSTTYLHMSAVDVRVGQRVRRGQRIGRIGQEGIATGPHLHWQMNLRGKVVDPLQWVLADDPLPLP